MKQPPSAYRIEQAMSVAHAVRARLLQDDPDLASDETALRDTLDGETDVFDLIRRLARFTLDAEATAAAAKERADNINARRQRYERRAHHARQAMFGMLDALGETKLEDAEFTVSLRVGRPSVIITDEAELPEPFVKVTRSPDKTAIAAALKAGGAVPGAEMANGMPTLTLKST